MASRFVCADVIKNLSSVGTGVLQTGTQEMMLQSDLAVYTLQLHVFGCDFTCIPMGAGTIATCWLPPPSDRVE